MNGSDIISILLLLGLVIFFFYIMSCEMYDCTRHDPNVPKKDGDGWVQYRGRGSPDESISMLLSRTYWLADVDIRRSASNRSFMVAFIATIFILIILYPWQIPPPLAIIVIFLFTFIASYAINRYFRYHFDRYTSYNIRNNMKIIAEKLGETVTDDVPPPIVPAPDPINTKIM